MYLGKRLQKISTLVQLNTHYYEKNIVAGNWKMNYNVEQTQQLINDLKTSLEQVTYSARVLVAPTFVNLSAAVSSTKGTSIEVAAQNVHQAESGAYTGEISADMLQSIGVKTVIIGHSERRTYFEEDDTLLKEKVKTALAKGMEIIFCFGEQLDDRKSGNHFSVVESQLKNVLFDLDVNQWKQLCLPTSLFGQLAQERPQVQHKLKRCMRSSET